MAQFSKCVSESRSFGDRNTRSEENYKGRDYKNREWKVIPQKIIRIYSLINETYKKIYITRMPFMSKIAFLKKH